MNILIIGLSASKGGIEKCIYDYISHMNTSGLSFGFIGNPDTVCYENEFKQLGCAVHPICNRKNIFHYYKQLCSIIKQYNYQIAHINMLSCANIIPLLAALHCNIKILCHSHNSGIPKVTLGVISLLRYLLHYLFRPVITKKSHVHIACSNMAGKFLYGKKAKFLILNNAIDVETFRFSRNQRNEIRNELKILDSTIVVGTVGRLAYQKNPEFTIKVFNEFTKINNDTVLLMVGSGVLLEKCKQLAKELGISEKVKFLGEISNIPSILSAMDVFLFPSHFEGLGIAGIEAQCSGLPILASTNISDEMAQSDLVTWLSLDLPVKVWAKKLHKLSEVKVNRELYPEILKERNFYIKNEVAKLRNMYMQIGEQ